MNLIIKNAVLVTEGMRRGDIYIKDGRFAAKAPAGADVIDAAGLCAAPGLVDMHVHLREPGQTHKRTLPPEPWQPPPAASQQYWPCQIRRPPPTVPKL